MSRYAAIDVGTNSALLLVAERDAEGRWQAVAERAEITRLGKGVDATRRLSPEAVELTLEVLTRFAIEARALGARAIAVTATSAARDAENGPEFLAAVQARAGLTVEILSGDDEARLAFASASSDFGGKRPLVVLDIGGGSTEFIFGTEDGRIAYRRSFDIGSVRMTERFLAGDPPAPAELSALEAFVRQTFSAVPRPPEGAQLVGVAGTVTTVCAVARTIEPWDATLVHGAELARSEVEATEARLAHLPVALRRTLPGLQPRRADVIVAGALILRVALDVLGAPTVVVSDRGLRWGLLADRFGAQP
ncbi:MAG: Ppx/GppA family phosphatase [Myxococcaceae bacterium]|jgi:exopolyphosphatase/guanosine-5'-triphosphate,3'-diphosphate pyrophosphatase|nr:Ppx/GppA family phosphatase [Myxococcaceae bacterium]MCA3011392.1 Ppx/GppA family phosphatase [Myxococcaceae bacterium]